MLDVFIGDLLIKAEEITHQVPQRDRRGWFWFIMGVIAAIVVGVGLYLYWQRRYN